MATPFVVFIGIVIVLKALYALFAPVKSIDVFTKNFLKQKWKIRVMGLVALAVGVLLIYS